MFFKETYSGVYLKRPNGKKVFKKKFILVYI